LDRIRYKGKELLPVKRDIVFKALFAGDSDLELLASLLASILDINIHANNLVVTNTELPPVHETGKLSRVDIRVKTEDGKHINVEIQLRNEYNMDRRSIFYLSKLYTDQMMAKMTFDELCPAIAINILDFIYLPFEEYHNRYRMKNTRNNHELTDVFEVNFIELPKAPKAGEGLKDLWMLFLSTDNEEVLDMLTSESPVFKKAISKLVYVSSDEKLRYELDMREKAELDYQSAMKTNYRKGKEEGKIEGKMEGKMEGKEETVAHALKEGMKPEDIVRYIGVSLEKVIEIKSKL